MWGLHYFQSLTTVWIAAHLHLCPPWTRLCHLFGFLSSLIEDVWVTSSVNDRTFLFFAFTLLCRLLFSQSEGGWWTTFRWRSTSRSLYAKSLLLLLLFQPRIPTRTSAQQRDVRLWHTTTITPSPPYLPQENTYHFTNRFTSHRQHGIRRRHTALGHRRLLVVFGPKGPRDEHIYHDAVSEHFHDALEEESPSSPMEQHRDDMSSLMSTLRNALRLVSRRAPILRPPEAVAYMTALEVLDRYDRVQDVVPSDRSRGLYFRSYLADGQTSADTPIVIDTGCSHSLTPFKEDFIGPLEGSPVDKMTGLKDSVDIQGVGWVRWPIRDIFNHVVIVQTRAYYVPDANIRLFSTQVYFQEAAKTDRNPRLTQDRDKVVLTVDKDNELTFNYSSRSNLPLMFLDWGIANLSVTSEVYNLKLSEELEATLTLTDHNHNLPPKAKELLLWHHRLAHVGMEWVKRLMRPRRDENRDVPPIIPTRVVGTPSCEAPKCPACEFGKAKRRPTRPLKKKTRRNRPDLSIRSGDLRPGDCVSMDQYSCSTPGRLADTYGKEGIENQYVGGTIFCDHATTLMYAHHTVGYGVGEVLQGKHVFEKFAKSFGQTIRSFRADNGSTFTSEDMLQDLALQGQTLTYSGTSAQHQNGVAERSIQTVTNLARSMMMHMALHWPNAYDEALWPFALDQAINIWNHLPKEDTGVSPMEMFTGTVDPHHNVIRHARVFGCPAYVLHPTLRDGRKVPRWTKRSRRGVYLGAAPLHASSIGRILSLETGHISPQFHVVYDEKFTSVSTLNTDIFFEQHPWERLYETGVERLTDGAVLSPDDPLPFQEFFDDFVGTPDSSDGTSVPEGDEPASEGEPDDDTVLSSDVTATTSNLIPPSPTPALSPSSVPEGELTDSDDDDDSVDRPSGATEEPPLRRSRRIRARAKPSSAGTYYGQALPDVDSSKYKRFQALRYLAKGLYDQKVRSRTLLNQAIQGLDWTNPFRDIKSVDSRRALLYLELMMDPNTGLMEGWNPMALAAKVRDEDNPTFEMATTGPDAEGYWKAMEIEYNTLSSMGTWEIVDREPWMNVVPGTWSYKKKVYPDGSTRKLKARFCLRGDRQVHGVDYFDTYAPVCSWQTVRLMMVLSIQMGLASKQVDYTAAFVQSEIPKPPDYDKMTPEQKRRTGVYAAMPRGFGQRGKVLKLKKTLYGAKDAPRNWFMHLKKRLEGPKLKFRSMTDVDPCLFINDKVICLVYVDDCLFFAKDVQDIDNTLAILRESLTLEEEDNVAGFLGVHIERSNGQIKLTQRGLTKRIIEALGAEDLPVKHTPANEVLGKETDGDPPECAFSTPSVIGMIWYLYLHSRPDLGFAISQISRFAWCTRRKHELALVRIGQYLKGTINEGLILKPCDFSQLKMDVYVDSDFAGLYGKEKREDPDNVKSRTGYVINLNDCPIIWGSKLQDSIALSTMMAEYYALSHVMKEVIPLRELTRAVAQEVGIDRQAVITFKTTIWEDNMGALTLANLEPGQQTPRSKFYDVRVHWFRSILHDRENNMSVEKVDTTLQLADMFTKFLPKDTFERLRKLLLGW